MQRLFRLSFLVALLSILAITAGHAQLPQLYESGKVEPGSVRVFVKDTAYYIDHEFLIAGTLIIEPGTTVKFMPDGRLVIAAGGRIIADGFARSTYNPNPDGIDPIGTPYSSRNPLGFSGYADLNYFMYKSSTDQTIKVDTKRDITVNPDKYDYIFNVILDKTNRKIIDLQNPGAGAPSNPNQVIIPFEDALMFTAARLEIDPNDDINLNIRPWQRMNYGSVNIAQQQIRFIGQPVNDVSREWGHIVVLPGARAAFFRNCDFENFRKDTTVDRQDYYTQADFPNMSADEIAQLNYNMRFLTNGSGGALTTFASRTWLLNCEFVNNMARHRGGALQILQSPAGFPAANLGELGFYASDKNPNITNSDGTISSVITNNPIPAIDMIDEAGTFEPVSDFDRQAVDDARLAVYLGRMRNLKFDHNKVQLANIFFQVIGTVRILKYDFINAADYPQNYGDMTFGGAIYIAGREGSEDRQIEVGLGVNNSIKIDGIEEQFDDLDSFIATANNADNYQAAPSTLGARGGAIYAGHYTSLIMAGEFSHNRTYTKFLQDSLSGTNSGYYSMGGAVFGENTFGRLQVRGGPKRDQNSNATRFYQNESGAGGAIFADGNADPNMSPIIGGTDFSANTRDYGFNILFQENNAITFGGAILAKRNFTINGAGGVMGTELLGYDDVYRVRFLGNTAGYSGGAIDIHLPNANILPVSQRVVKMVRALFRDNVVGQGITDRNKPEIRGGGALYSLNADLNVVKGVEFNNNTVYNGNGGAIALINPQTSFRRYFLTDLDQVATLPDGIAYDYQSYNDVFSTENLANQKFPADARMLTRFIDNKIAVDSAVLATQSGSGTTQVGKGTIITSSQLYGTAWIDNNTGYAVGFDGVIIKFTNGGKKWAYQNSGTHFRLNKVFFTTATTGFVAGDRGIILKTTNGGTNWFMTNTPSEISSLNVNDIYFAGTNNGYAVCNGGYILKSADAGNTWTLTQPDTRNINSVFFTSLNTGYAVGQRGLIYKTTDAGSSWDLQFIPGLIVDLNHISFVDQATGYIVGNAGAVVKTTNSGSTWTRVNVATSQDLRSTFFTDQLTGFAVGTFGSIFKTIDGGANWTAATSGTSYSLYDVFFPTASVGYASGDFGLLLGTTDAGGSWNAIRPTDESNIDVVRYHPDLRLPENGVGLGGAIYILDSISVNRIGREDSVKFNRVRIQNNSAYTGAAIYSDNFDLKLIFNRSLITGNTAISDVGVLQNAITGPVIRNDTTHQVTHNNASSDLAGAVIYGEIQGPLPSQIFSEAANSIFDNHARFLIRLPDAPNSKGVLAGTTGIGFGGTDTLRGNYWGKTEANLDMVIQNNQGSQYDNATFSTFFIDQDGQTHLQFLFPASTDPRNQGPFETNGRYTYTPIPLYNEGDVDNTPGTLSIPEQLLMSGKVYDIYDKGTDIKTADYTKRRMTPIEDFAVGLPPIIRRFDSINYPSYGKYVKRLLRDPFIADSQISGNYVYPFVHVLQDEFRADKSGNYYHPIGYPLFLEAQVDYTGLAERSNFDTHQLDETVFFVINETTGDFIRVNLKQVSKDAPYRDIFRTRVELVPDSTDRTPNSLIRRTAEGLLNLGTGNFLLRELEDNPYKEDRATLPGRKYDNPYTSFARVSDLFSNRPSMPASNQGRATYFAGERFHALPVDTGDVVRIISRTVLWKEGPISAYDDGISFKIVRSTPPPVFTGNIVSLQTDTIIKIVPSDFPSRLKDTIKLVEFLNTIFLSEDREYPWTPDLPVEQYSTLPLEGGQGRDSILSITAMDTNKYYDPRSYLYDTLYSRLTYTWAPIDNPIGKQYNAASGLRRWLFVDSVKAADSITYVDPNTGEVISQNPRDEAEGYFVFRGRPINPYVVPGGEYIKVTAANYPPFVNNVDALKALGVGQDSIDAVNYIFPPYFHAEKYDTANARYAQQDTINFGKAFKTNDYVFRIFVTDSLPRFLNPGGAVDSIFQRLSRNPEDKKVYVVYDTSTYKCGFAPDGVRLLANLTDKLRFQADFNTDDEMEDYWALKWEQSRNITPAWDFRYGKTAYGFMNIAVRSDDTTVIDSTTYEGKYGMDGSDTTIISQTRPVWMNNQFIYRYDLETPADADIYAIDFTSAGKLNVRIPRDEAVTLLTPPNQVNGSMNLDTVFTVVVNDGHGGMTFKTLGVQINVSPLILDANLPAAKEDEDYNPQLIDSARMIKVYDPNFDQKHTFELIYVDDVRNTIPKDACYAEAGNWDVSNLHLTPKWLKINTESGILYGTPSVTDAPRDETVVVLVTDEGGLTDLKTFPLRVDSTNHRPKILSSPPAQCVDRGKPYTDTILVTDRDLLRVVKGSYGTETLTVSVVAPTSGINARFVDTQRNTITGTLTEDQVNKGIKVEIYTDNFNVPRDPDGKVTITISVRDANGAETQITYRVKMSDPTDFLCNVKVENNFGAFQILTFGTAERNATTGDGDDGSPLGTLDSLLCEFELPPLPPLDVFDARWTIPTRTGTIRDLFPRGIAGRPELHKYSATFQAGGVIGNVSEAYPVTIAWSKGQIPDKQDATANPSGASWYIRDGNSLGNYFNINMKTGLGQAAPGISVDNGSDSVKIGVTLTFINGFVILHDWNSDVPPPVKGLPSEAKIYSVSPNPFNNGSAAIDFGLPVDNKIKMEVVDALGNVISTVADAVFTAGSYTLYWNGRDASGHDVPSGTYTCRLTAGGVRSVYPMVVIK